MHLAQLNIAHLRAPTESEQLKDFIDLLEPINAIADVAPGFVWRMKGGPEPDAVTAHEFGDHLLINMSVWEDRDTLWNFVYRSPHLPVLQRRKEWFHRIAEPYTVLWWIPEGSTPTLAEGMERLERLKASGPGPAAFTFRDFYDSSEAASLPAAAEARK
ncbi:hypothetical protein Misp01_33050 [Microtetraspora sp. NBRC 13810]|uniref:DUF3291 domain-containing protein n=1 Tax=Microtetraspora sp. NBRC 13810 TaxID=3030990 RepID=UPI0024A338C6|nr:DUF3291 domain-containing protein [Microtetraspora sp. NBRC 13810]GLW08175.1 hypothetical protein Misp01_33050 [Microtetraspora sp. NBRC 13810]